MRRPTEYHVMKIILREHVENDPDFSGRDANKLIIDHVADAYEKTKGKDHDWIEANVINIIRACHKKACWMSENGALELLAAIGNLDLEVK